MAQITEEERLRKSAEIAVELCGGTVEGWLADFRAMKVRPVNHPPQDRAVVSA